MSFSSERTQQHLPACAWNQSGGKESCSCEHEAGEYWNRRCAKAEAERDLYWDWLNTSLPPCPEDDACDCPRCQIEKERNGVTEEKP